MGAEMQTTQAQPRHDVTTIGCVSYSLQRLAVPHKSLKSLAILCELHFLMLPCLGNNKTQADLDANVLTIARTEPGLIAETGEVGGGGEGELPAVSAQRDHAVLDLRCRLLYQTLDLILAALGYKKNSCQASPS